MTSQVRSLLRRFYAAQIDGNFNRVWQLTSARYQRHQLNTIGFAHWKANQRVGESAFSGANGISASIIESDPADGSVTVEARGLRFHYPGSSCSFWEGVTWARFERGRWVHDPYAGATASRAAEWGPRSDQVIGAGCL